MQHLRLQLHDDTATALHDRAEQAHCDVEVEATRLLRQTVPIWPRTGRAVVLSGPTLQRLEEILGGGSLLHEGDLLRKVERLAGISFGHLRLDFSPGQLENLQERAAREGKTVRDLVVQMAPRITEQFFGLIDLRP